MLKNAYGMSDSDYSTFTSFGPQLQQAVAENLLATSNHNLDDLLNMGVRYLDLRVAKG